MLQQQQLVVNGRVGTIWVIEKNPEDSSTPEFLEYSLTDVDGRPIMLVFDNTGNCGFRGTKQILALRAVHYNERNTGRKNLYLSMEYGTKEKIRLVETTPMTSGKSVEVEMQNLFHRIQTRVFGGKYDSIEAVFANCKFPTTANLFSVMFMEHARSVGITLYA